MLNKLRATTITVFCAYILFIIAGLAFQKMTEYDDFTAAMSANAALSITYKIIVICSAIALLAVFIGGLPIVFDAAIHAYKTHRRDLLLLLVPPLSLALIIGTILLITTLAPHIIFPNPLAIVHATNEQLLRSGHLLAIVTTASMALMLIATLIWGLILQAQDPQLFTSNNGILGASTALSWLAILIAMALATAIAIIALLLPPIKQKTLVGALI
jgi:hypothetical protein